MNMYGEAPYHTKITDPFPDEAENSQHLRVHLQNISYKSNRLKVQQTKYIKRTSY